MSTTKSSAKSTTAKSTSKPAASKPAVKVEDNIKNTTREGEEPTKEKSTTKSTELPEGKVAVSLGLENLLYKEKEIIDWGEAVGILGSSSYVRQLRKTVEEVAELAHSLNHDKDVLDDIGDIYVTLILASALLPTRAINKRAITTTNNYGPEIALPLLLQFVGAAFNDATSINKALIVLNNITINGEKVLTKSIDIAFDEIKGRVGSGKMVNGVFVKDGN